MKYAINLFPSKKSHVGENFGYFVTHYFRYALVLTMAAILIIFFLRVQVDQKLADEREKLAMKKAIVTTTRPLRTDLENAQRKITLIKGVFTKQDNLLTQLDYITQIIPKNSIVQSILIDEKQIEIHAITPDFRLIQQLVSRITKDAKFDKVKAGEIQKEGNKQYSFSITLEGFKTSDVKKS